MTGKKTEIIAMVDTVLIPQLLACKATLAYIEQQLDGNFDENSPENSYAASYAFEQKVRGVIEQMISEFQPGAWVREAIEAFGDD